MRLISLCSVALLVLASASFGVGGCDDSTSDDEAALPGVGPIGAGGAPDLGGPGGAGAGGSAAGAGQAGMSGSSGQGGAGACATGGGDGKVRLAAMRARAGKVDVCAASTSPGAGAADWATATRLVRALGDAAHDGLAFAEVASPSTLAAGPVTFRVIDAAAADCTGEPLAERDVCLAAGDDLTLVLLADSLAPFVNAPATDGNRLRFIHAYAGGPGLDVGLADPDSGVMIPPPIFTNITYGTTAPASATSTLGPPVLASGYLDLPASDQTAAAPVGAAPTGQTASLLKTVVDLSPPKGRVLTAYAVGASGDASWALAGRLCDETKTQGALTTCLAF